MALHIRRMHVSQAAPLLTLARTPQHPLCARPLQGYTAALAAALNRGLKYAASEEAQERLAQGK